MTLITTVGTPNRFTFFGDYAVNYHFVWWHFGIV